MIKKNRTYQIVILVFVFISGTYSLKADSIPNIELATIAQVNQGNSYVTFPTDIGNIAPLWFEGNIIPNFHIRTSPSSKFIAVLTPQIIIRMYQEYSFPVKTPSYRPQIALYYRAFENDKSTIGFTKLVHHSNGQNGDFFLEDGSINLETGDFSTQYLEMGFIRTFYNSKFNANQFFQSSFERHFFEADNLQHGLYSMFRLKSSFAVFKISENQKYKKKKKAGFSMRVDTEWMFGDIYTWSTHTIDRFNIRFQAFYAPKFLEDIGFFMELYHGQDYYNIYFNQQLDVIRFGLMTEKLRF